jgi:hypothetical protein
MFGGGLLDFSNSNNKAVAEIMCQTAQTLTLDTGSTAALTSVLGNNAVQAINACTQTKGVQVDGAFPNEDTLTLAMAYLPSVGDPPNAYREFTSAPTTVGAVTCTGPLASVVNHSQLTTNSVGMTCVRSATTAATKGGPYGQYTVYDGGVIVIYTTAGLYSFTFPKKVVGPACSPQPTGLSISTLSNLCVGCLGNNYGPVVTDTLQASQNGGLRAAEYVANVPSCGDYVLRAQYASLEARPVSVLVNGVGVSTFSLANTTGGFAFANQQWFNELLMPLPAGMVIIRLERTSPFPHVQNVMLMPR